MMKNSLLKAELSTIFSNKKILIPIIAVLCVPVLYAGLFLWAFWDPYAKMDRLPVAIVNSDQGAKFNGDNLKLGDELVKRLTKSKQFGFETVSKDKGYRDLKKQKYYMLIEIPKDFSQNATTLLDKNPKKLTLIYVPNESYNFLSAQIGGTATYKVKTAVAEQVTKTYAETMFQSLSKLTNGINQADDGAGKISDGSVKLHNGAKDLSNGLATLSQKSVVFNNSMKTANSGAEKLAAGSINLYNGLTTMAKKSIEFDQGIKQAASGSNDLAQGASKLESGLNEVHAKLPQLIAGTNQAASGAEKMKNQLPAGIASQISTQISGNIGQVDTGVNQFKSKLGTAISTQVATTMADQTITQIYQQTQTMSTLQKSLIAGGIPQQSIPKIMQPIMEQQKQALIAGGIPEQMAQQILQKPMTKDELQQMLQVPLQKQIQPQVSSELSSGLNQGFTQFNKQLDGQLLASTNGLEAKIKSQTDPAFNQLINGIGTINQNQKLLQLGIQKLSIGSTTLSNGADHLTSGMRQISAGSEKLTTGTGQLVSGSNDLLNGASHLSNGMNQLTAGAGALTNGAGKLSNGSDKLTAATSDLSKGADKLATKLHDGAKQASKVHSNDKTYDMMAKPVNLDTESLHRVPNYGTGFTPYFLSLGLFVGALILSIVFPFVEPAIKPANGFSWFLSKFLILTVLGIIQALIADAVILGVLQLHVQSVPRFILVSIFTSFVFVTLIQMFVSMFGDVGRFIGILILIFQLTTSAGTFPLELIPKFLQHFNAFLPMTYTVQGFKAAISSGDFSFMWQNIMILLLFIVIFISGTIAYFNMKFHHEYKKEVVEN